MLPNLKLPVPLSLPLLLRMTSTGIQLSDAEVLRDYGMVTVHVSAQGGTVEVSATAGAFFEVGNAAGAQVEFKFLAALRISNLAVETLGFTPTTGFVGNASVTVTVDDQGWSGSGGALTASTTLTIVNAVFSSLVR